ncbi:MAG: hypothetical protein ACOYW4_01775 [Bacillota bacterium]
MTIGELIEAIGPLNNRFRETDGIERIEVLWDIGEVLQRAGDGPLDRLLWAIQQRSFITRDLLRYASIVRRNWEGKEQLRRELGGVKSYALFRAALPFLKGDRNGIDDATHREILCLIAGTDTHRAHKHLRALKEKHIGRKHHKGISREKVANEVASFLSSVATLESDLRRAPLEIGKQIRGEFKESLGLMAKVLYALATGGFIPGDASDSLGRTVRHPLVAPVVAAAIASRDEKSAFVKAVTPNLLMELADLFLALRTEESFNQWQKRPHTLLKIGG